MNKHVDAPVQIAENIWQFNEANQMGPYVDAYLIVGQNQALLVDALQTETGLYEEVRKITDKPLTVFITHGHLDHAGAAIAELHDAGVPIYMSYKDYDLLKGMYDYGEEKDWFIDLKPGMVFDLGGYRFHTIAINGHSKGSMVALDYENQLLFSGDGIGSGHFWMQTPFSTALNIFQMGLKALYEETRKCPDLKVYPGHRNQSPVQLTGQYVRDTLFITNGLLNGTLKGEPTSIPWQGGEMHYYHIGHGQMVDYCYDPDNFFFCRPDPEIEAVKDKFTREQVRQGSRAMDYMLFSPETEEGRSYPLVIYLHGAGERGNDPRLALANSGGYTFAMPDWQKKHPCYVAAPQVAENEWWTDDWYMEMIVRLIMTLSFKGAAIDRARVYITGLSMGGMGTWKMISKYSGLFAAAMPICGAGDPFEIRAAKDVPVWAFHAADDPVVKADGYLSAPFEGNVGSRWLVNALRGAGAADVRYTEYPAGWMEEHDKHPHSAWEPAYANEQAKEWMFSKVNDRYDIHWIMPGFYWIEDAKDASLYLIEGTERALVVDTGFTEGDFVGMIKTLTRLPVDLAVTHCHGDHMYHLDQFDRYYMSEKDVFLLNGPRMKQAYGGKDYSHAQLIPVQDGDIIDLGGGYQVEVFDLGGHTPGSVVYLDKKRKIALCGDALGVWMQVIGATSLAVYKHNLEHFLERMSAPEYEGVVMMNGHRKQEGGYFPYGSQYCPNDLQKVRDMITLCDLIQNEEVEYQPFTMRTFGEPAYTAKYGQATIVFTQSSLEG